MTRGHISASYTVQAMQPGNPSSSALGEFTINLHPPGSEGYLANKPIYDQLEQYDRIEMYESHDGASLGKLVFAGPITGIAKQSGEGAHFTLTGTSDLQWANLSAPFPGETLPGGATTTVIARNYLGVNLPRHMDSFSSFTSANYTSTNLPTKSAGTWSSSTDEGQGVVSCSTGTGAALISKMGAPFPTDLIDNQFVEVAGRLKPSTDNANAGIFGVLISGSSQDLQNSALVYVTAKATSGAAPYKLNVTRTTYTNGLLNSTTTVTDALTSVDDGGGFISITISLWEGSTAQVVVNGMAVFPAGTQGSIQGNFVGTTYPGLIFGTPTSGTATAYMANLVQMTRLADLGSSASSPSVFKLGSVGTPTQTLPAADPTPTFLEMWSRSMTREGWYWRYTPQPYVLGTPTLGVVDLVADPGTDRGSDHSIIFSRDAGNLVGLQLSANADQFATGTAASSVAGTDGGGIAHWVDIPAMSKYGAIEDQALVVPAATFAEQRQHARQVISNKTTVGATGSKAALVLRDPQTVGKWRELDKVLIHDPEMGINNQVSRILSYTFDEGSDTQSVILDQFGAEHIPVPAQGHRMLHFAVPPHVKRFQQGLFGIAKKFKNR